MIFYLNFLYFLFAVKNKVSKKAHNAVDYGLEEWKNGEIGK